MKTEEIEKEIESILGKHTEPDLVRVGLLFAELINRRIRLTKMNGKLIEILKKIRQILPSYYFEKGSSSDIPKEISILFKNDDEELKQIREFRSFISDFFKSMEEDIDLDLASFIDDNIDDLLLK